MGEGTELFPDVFRVDQLESDDLFQRDEDERFELRRQQAAIAEQQVLAPEPDDPTIAPQPTGEDDDGGTRLLPELFASTIGGVLGEIRDIAVNVDTLTDATLTALGILEEDEKEGILGLQELLPDIREPETTAGRIVRGLVEFGTGFLLFGAAGRAAGITSKLLLTSVAGTAEAGFGKGEDEGRLTDLITQIAPSLEDDRIIGGLVQFLQTSDDETALETFAKDVVEDVLLGFGFQGAGFVAKRLAEGLQPGVIKRTLADQGGAVDNPLGGDGRPVQGPIPSPEDLARDQALRDQGLDPRVAARLASFRREPEALVEDLTGTTEVLQAVDDVAEVITDRVAKEVDTALASEAGPALLATPQVGNYSKEVVAKVARTADINNPLFRTVANFTVEKSREIAAAADDALTNGFTTENRQAAYTGLQELIEGYRKFDIKIGQGREVVTAQTVADTGRASRYTRTLIKSLQDGSAGIDEETFFRELLENPSRLGQAFAAGSRNFSQLTGDLITELFYSGALSSPATLVRASLGAPLLFGYETASKVIGGVLSLNKTGLLGEAGADLNGAFGAIWDGLREVKVSFGDEGVSRAALNIRGLPAAGNTIAGETFGVGGRLGSAIDVIGNIIRFPTRTLGAIDKGTGLVVERMILHREAFRRAQAAVASEGIQGARAKVLHRDVYNDALITGKTEELTRVAKLETRRLTLSKDLDPGLTKEFNNLINSNPFTRILVPFVKVSSNALIQSIEKTPGLAFIQSSQRAILRGGDSRAIAELAGRQTLGAAVMAGAGYLTLNGFMTGAAPQNPSSRQAWILSGRKEYSFNYTGTDGQNVSVQYAKLGEPLGFMLGMVADLTHGFSHIEDELREADDVDRTVFDEAAEVLGLAFAQNLSKRTFMQSVVDLSQAATDPGRFLAKFAGSTVATLIPAGGLIASIDRELNPELPEIEGFMERVRSRVPWFNQSLPPRRNLFGEVQEFQPGFGSAFVSPELVFGIAKGVGDIFSPVIMNSVDESDPSVVIGNTIRENRLVPEGVRPPTTFRGVKLTREETDFIALRRGEIEIGGRNLKEALFELVQDPIFQDGTPGRDGIQEALLSRVIKGYTQLATAEAVQKFGNIFERVEERISRTRGF